MKVLHANNDTPGIMIVCPHCKLGSRYEASYIEDAIKIRHNIVCVACGDEFNLIVYPIAEVEKAPTRDRGGEI